VKRYIIPAGTSMFVANDAEIHSWPRIQPTGEENIMHSTQEVVYDDTNLVKTETKSDGLLIFRLPPNPFGPFLVVTAKQVQIIDE